VNSFATAFQVYVAGLVFARVGAMVMTMPGIGEQSVPPRVRLAFALLMALILGPLVQNTVPPIPNTLGGLVGGVIHEILIGLMIGSILRLFMISLTTAGEIISMQTTLSFAQSVNPSMQGSSTAVASFLSMMGLTLIMATGLHHLFIGAIVKSYTIFPFTRAVPINDAVTLAVRTVAQSFSLGIQLAAPVICVRPDLQPRHGPDRAGHARLSGLSSPPRR
jgi:flagellar biosynthesis protein FliR